MRQPCYSNNLDEARLVLCVNSVLPTGKPICGPSVGVDVVRKLMYGLPGPRVALNETTLEGPSLE